MGIRPPVEGVSKVHTQFPPVVANRVQFEAVKPSRSTFTPFGKFLKDPVAADAFVVADGDSGTVHESDSGTFTGTDRIWKEHQRDKNTVFVT
jgi:hypothetical protein